MKLLCIDDDLDDLQLLSEVVRTTHPEMACMMTTSSSEGLSLLTTAPPDLIFLDVNMPEINGRDLLNMIRRNKSFDKIKICMLSTSISPSECETYKKIGADFCLHKPASFNSFKAAISRVLQDPKLPTQHG